MELLNASVEKPFLLWKHNGIMYGTNKVKVIPSSTLRNEQRKFWSRLIKPSYRGRMTKYNRGTQVCRQKEIYYCPMPQFLSMIHKNLKVSVRVKPFNKSLVQQYI